MQSLITPPLRDRSDSQGDPLTQNIEAQMLASDLQQRILSALNQQEGAVNSVLWQETLRALSQEAAKLASAEVQHSVPPAPPAAPARRQKLPRRQQARELAASERQQGCRRIGEVLREARVVRSLSHEDLALRTYIRPVQLVALEAGELNNPDDDIYLRGFLKRLSPVLGLNEAELLAAVPAPIFSPTPSWYEQYKLYRNHRTPGHYCFYVTLLTSAATALNWGIQQQAPNAMSEPALQPPPVARSERQLFHPTIDTGVMAPPEQMP